MLAFILCVAFIFFCLPFSSIKAEKAAFNNSICPKCGKPMIRFSTLSSSGERGYICIDNDCKYHTWVYYKSVDKNYLR